MRFTNKKNLIRYIGIFLKGLMLILTFWFIYNRIFTTQNLDEIITYFEEVLTAPFAIVYLSIALLLVIVNWGIEAMKWRYLILKIERLSFFTAFRAVISGVTISVFTPNRIGEYAGRVVYIKKGDRISATLITVISSLSQLTITLLVGTLGTLFYFWYFFPESADKWVFQLGVQLYILFAALLILAFVNTPLLTIMLSKVKFMWARFKKYIKVFSFYRKRDLIWVLTLSFLRFIIFSLQYFLLFRFFQVDITVVESIILVPVYLISLTAIPTITLAELGVREVLVLTIFQGVTTNEIGLVSTTFCIWLINLALPAILGTIFVLQTRLFKSE